jgi:hypothetical protein
VESGATTGDTPADDAAGGVDDRFRASAGLALTWGSSQIVALLVLASFRRGVVSRPPELVLGAVAATAASSSNVARAPTPT